MFLGVCANLVEGDTPSAPDETGSEEAKSLAGKGFNYAAPQVPSIVDSGLKSLVWGFRTIISMVVRKRGSGRVHLCVLLRNLA